MNTFSNLSVRRKLTLVIMLISTVSLLLASAAFIISDRLHTKQQVADNLLIMAEMIAANSTATILFKDYDAAVETLAFLGSQDNIQAGVIFDSNQEPFTSYHKQGSSIALPELSSQASNVLFWDNHVEVFTDITYEGEQIGTVYLRSDMQVINKRLALFLGIVTLVLLASLLVAFALNERLQYIITAPLLRLSAIARQISTERNYSLRVAGESRDELGTLIKDFNTMLGEIEMRDKKLKQHKEDLEARVVQRTRELEKANKELAASKQQAESVAMRMQHQAQHDALTGLPNRSLLNDRIQIELSHARREQTMLAILFLDLDRFKIINDSLGHATGDQLLCVVARRLKKCLREGDTVARLGGDEFMVLLPRLSTVADAGRIGNKIIQDLAMPASCNGHKLHITTSVGISVYPFDGSDADTLVKHADISMYRAKELGRNKAVYFTSGMNAGSRKRLVLETNLRRALEKDEFRLQYQPKVDISDNRIVGVEALLRWDCPGMGFISPREFIPIAEESGLIAPIGEWVLRQALAQLEEWHAAGHSKLTLAVNLSAAQVSRPGLEDTLKKALLEFGINPSCMELEITEHAAMKDIESSTALLEKMKALGVSIAMDDFGTGYSSLSYLRRLPIDTVKLDRSFVHEIPDNTGDVLIAQAIIAMTKSLNMELVVEGIDNQQQLEFFRQEGCRLVQGFLFSKPVSADTILAMLKAQNVKGAAHPSRW
jgi:diguanylate cyclase (GGDEF)-like protein/prepilin-type processing-associated H-X9-DG protein